MSDPNDSLTSLVKKNPVATLVTLILLSYGKILHTIIAALSSAVLKYPGPNGQYNKVTVWLPDATVEYLKGRHIVLFLTALLILLAGLTYTTLLFSWQWLQRFSESRLFSWTRNQKLSLFIETYHAPYTPKSRYWTGLLLLVRVILYIASAANVSGDPKIDLLITGSVILAVLLINKMVGIGNHVYKKWPIEILEVACLMNLILLCLTTFFSLDNKKTRAIVTNISMSITFVLLLGILLYHSFTELIANLKAWKKCSGSQFQRSDRQLEEGNSLTSLPTSMVIDGPKKEVNYNQELREALLDYSYSANDDTVATH